MKKAYAQTAAKRLYFPATVGFTMCLALGFSASQTETSRFDPESVPSQSQETYSEIVLPSEAKDLSYRGARNCIFPPAL